MANCLSAITNGKLVTPVAPKPLVVGVFLPLCLGKRWFGSFSPCWVIFSGLIALIAPVYRPRLFSSLSFRFCFLCRFKSFHFIRNWFSWVRQVASL